MRILHLNLLYPPLVRGGAERFVATLAREQARQGHDVGVVTLTPAPPQPPSMEDGVLVHRIGNPTLFWSEEWPKHSAPARYANKLLANWNPIVLRRVRKVVASFRPDVVNSHCMIGFAVDSWKAATERNIPVVHALHELNLFCRNSNAFRDGRMCEGICLACRITEPKRWLSRHVSAVIGVSRDVLQQHLDRGFFRHIPPERRFVIGSMPRFAPQERSAPERGRPFTIGFIGRIIPEKGLSNLLAAVEGLPPSGWRLLIGGPVSPPLDEAALRAQTAHLPVEWLGFVEPTAFFPRVDLLVVPAIWADPYPLVVIEAFAHGVPVVGSRLGGITDMIEDGVTGWTYRHDDVAALRAILAERLKKGRDALPTAAAFAPFLSNATPERVAKRYTAAYRSVASAA
jgi:glycosyltransferase involved in cell wall biosynthesis